MRAGDSVTITRSFSADDVAAFAGLCGASPTPGVPEPLLGAMFSYLLGVKLPGPGANYLKQNTTYHAPAEIGAPITASVTVTRLRPDKRLVDLETVARDGAGRLLCDGRALLIYPEP